MRGDRPELGRVQEGFAKREVTYRFVRLCMSTSPALSKRICLTPAFDRDGVFKTPNKITTLFPQLDLDRAMGKDAFKP